MKRKSEGNPMDEKEQVKRRQRRWTTDEITGLFNHLQDTVDKVFAIEKPNALAYYKDFLDANPMPNCTAISVRDKVRHLLKSYQGAVRWSNQTGQGVLQASGESTFQAALLKQFKYFKEAEGIWGSKMSVHVPYTSSSCAIGPNQADQTTVAVYKAKSNHGMGDSDEITIEDVTESNVDHDTHAAGAGGSESELKIVSEEIIATTCHVRVRSPKLQLAGNSRAEKFLTPPDGKVKISPKSARDTYFEVSKMRMNTARERMCLQKDQLAVDRSKADADVQLRREQFEFEKGIRSAELELKREQLQNESQIRLKELEVEKMKIELEFQKSKR